jgi:type VI secretion system protein ImpI
MRVVNTQDNSVLERTFDRSPVRIGRSSLNELQIQAPFVSQYHAVLEFDGAGKRLQLRDLGSTNGTALRATGRVPPNTVVDLSQHNFEFAIVSLWFQLFFVSDVPVKSERKREGTILSMDVNELQKIMAGIAAGGGAPAATGGPDRTREVMTRLQPSYDEYRASWAKFYRELFGVANTLDASARGRLLQQMQADMGAVQNEGDFQRLAAHFGQAPTTRAPQAGGAATTREEAVALQALRDLASTFVPQRGQLERVVDIVAFAQKMQDVLDTFFKCFLPLRDGHSQFKQQMDIKKTRPPKEQLNAARAVEVAREPRELGARLLDWTDPSNEGPRAVESTFAEVMVHQVAMLSGVMKGVRSLLAKLAPQSIESEMNNPRRKSSGGMQIGPWRFKSLWELYTEVYGDFAEEKQAFMLIFGPEFAHAYSELAGEAAAAGPQGPHPSHPGMQAPPNAFAQPGLPAMPPQPPNAFAHQASQPPPAPMQQGFPQPAPPGPYGPPPQPPGPVAPPPHVQPPPMVGQPPPQPGQPQHPPTGPWTGGPWPPRR